MKLLTRKRIIWLSVFFLAFVMIAYAVATFDIRARQMPSRLETVVATRAKHWLVARAVHREPPIAPFAALDNPPGPRLFMACCSTMVKAIATSVDTGAGHCSSGSIPGAAMNHSTRSMTQHKGGEKSSSSI